jgi:Ca-activated chloride channel homolog
MLATPPASDRLSARTSASRRKPYRACGLAALVAASIISVAAPPADAAGLLIPTGAPNGRSLSIASQQVDVHINNGIAVTTVTQVFHNDAPRPLEARYIFPIPARASVSNFSMWINGAEVVGEVVEKREGQRIYDSIARPERPERAKDPGLLEETNSNTFEMRVFPVPANGDQRIQIAYYQPLDYENGFVRYVYPLALRHAPGAQMNGALNITLEARSDIPFRNVTSPSHPEALAGTEVAKNTFRAGIEESRGRLDRDFVVYFELERPDMCVNLLTSRTPGEDGFFMMSVTPGAELDRDPHPINATFVIDSSGSMAGEGKLSAACRAALAAVRALRSDDTFNLVAFNVAPSAMSEQPIAADEGGIARAETFVRGLSAKGGTDILSAIDAAVRQSAGERDHCIVLLSDGEATNDTPDHTPYLRMVNAATSKPRVVTIGVGNDVNRPLLDRLARDSGGFVAYLSGEDDVNAIAPEMVQRLRVPYAREIQVAANGNGVELYDLTPSPMINLYHGGQFVLYGRYRGTGDAKLTLAADIAGEARTIALDAKFPAADASAPEIQRMWAWHRIQDLLRAEHDGNASASVQNDVVALGTAYSITSPYTSFLVLENEQMYRDFGVERRNRERLATERTAQATRQAADASSTGQQFRPMDAGANSGGGHPTFGGGAISPVGLVVMAGSLLAGGLLAGRKRRTS